MHVAHSFLKLSSELQLLHNSFSPIFEQLIKISSKFVDGNATVEAYKKIKHIFESWRDVLRRQNSFFYIDLKEYFKDSVFMIGKNHVMQIGLGKTEDDEIKRGSSKLNIFLKGNCGLFFTDKTPEEIIPYFKEYSSPYFGNVGSISNQTLILKRGFDEHLADFPSSMESQFRQLGMNIKIDNGKFCLLDDYIVCQEGKGLTPDQCKMCKHLGINLDEFKIYIKAYLGNNGLFKEIKDE